MFDSVGYALGFGGFWLGFGGRTGGGHATIKCMAAAFPYVIMALLLFWLYCDLQDRYDRIKSGLPPDPPRSRLYRWVRIVWAVIFSAYIIWVFSSWFPVWFGKR